MGAIDTSYTFTATDVITSAKMNNILDQSTMTATAIIGDTLAVTAGKLFVKAGGITSNEIGSNAVTTTAITDLNVTTGKIAELSVTTEKLNDLSVTTGKIADSGVTTVKIADANVTAAKLSGTQTGTAPIYGARAWVSFDGFITATIKASGNIATVVRNSVGRYTVTFATAMVDANYAVVWGGSTTNSGTYRSVPHVSAKTTTEFVITFFTANNSTGADQGIVDLVIFR